MGLSHGVRKPPHHIKWMKSSRKSKRASKSKKSKSKDPIEELLLSLGISTVCRPTPPEDPQEPQDLLDEEGFHILKRK